jgi:hypothetical protein
MFSSLLTSRVRWDRVAGALGFFLTLAAAACESSMDPGEEPGDAGPALYVDARRGSDANAGTREAPLATISAALARVSGETVIRVAAGTYPAVVLRSGARLFGGHDGMSWQRDPRRNATILESANGPAVAALSVNAATLDGFTVRSAAGTSSSPTSIAIRLWGSRDVTLAGNTIEAGRGAAGRAGDAGEAHARAESGDDGVAGGYCTTTRVGGAGGSGAGRAGGKGGTGGFAAGMNGEAGEGALGGKSGDRDSGGPIEVDHDGGTGGSATTPGSDGAGGGPFGQLDVRQVRYIPADGQLGSNGSPGGGGGGGGGGAGVAPTGFCGSGGGGGGAGGLGGNAGAPGAGGGASIGILIYASTANVTGNVILSAGGGAGGAGGRGGAGGLGGFGGDSPDGGFFAGNPGGKGGAGGTGSAGGHGGGGGGGPSIGIMDEGSSVTVAGNTFQLGPAGKGGASAGRPGADGLRQEILKR